MDLIFDTHALFWLSVDHPQLSRGVVAQLGDPDTRTFISAVTIWEYGDLQARGRLPGGGLIEDIREQFGFEFLDFPVSAWKQAALLPSIHRDPVDRMLVAHALEADLTLVTADRALRSYPVRTLW